MKWRCEFNLDIKQPFPATSLKAKTEWKLGTEKKGELLRAIASKKNFSNLHSAAFVTVFARYLVHAYNFRIFQKTAR